VRKSVQFAGIQLPQGVALPVTALGSQHGIYDILNIKGCPGTDSLLSDAFRSAISLEDNLFDSPTEDNTHTLGLSLSNTSAQDVDVTLAESLSKSLHIDVEDVDVHMN